MVLHRWRGSPTLRPGTANTHQPDERLLVAQLHDHQSNTLVGSTPVLLADAWEHAYYLDYRNDKQAWSKAFFAVADWRSAQERFAGRVVASTASR